MGMGTPKWNECVYWLWIWLFVHFAQFSFFFFFFFKPHSRWGEQRRAKEAIRQNERAHMLASSRGLTKEKNIKFILYLWNIWAGKVWHSHSHSLPLLAIRVANEREHSCSVRFRCWSPTAQHPNKRNMFSYWNFIELAKDRPKCRANCSCSVNFLSNQHQTVWPNIYRTSTHIEIDVRAPLYWPLCAWLCIWYAMCVGWTGCLNLFPIVQNV